MLCRGIMDFTKVGDKLVNDLDLLSVYVVGVSCLHCRNPCRRIFMPLVPSFVLMNCSLLVAFFCNALFLFLLLFFIRTSPCAGNFSEHFFGDTKCKKPRHTLKTSLCCAFYWRIFYFLCFNMYKTPIGLLSLPEIETKNDLCQKRTNLSRRKKNSRGLPFYSFQ